jgi:hypothetical protein
VNPETFTIFSFNVQQTGIFSITTIVVIHHPLVRELDIGCFEDIGAVTIVTSSKNKNSFNQMLQLFVFVQQTSNGGRPKKSAKSSD